MVSKGSLVLALAVPIGAAAQEPPSPPPRFGEVVDVERVVTDVRVLDGRGRPIRGLGPGDFRVKVDGQPVRLESVLWIPGDTSLEPIEDPATGATVVLPPSVTGRTIVFFFQKDVHPSRIKGLLRMVERAARMLDGLGEDDFVAVASFDSHLKLWLDFTRDRGAARAAIRHSVLHESRPPAIGSFFFPSLAASFDPAAARDAATPEEALRVLGEALTSLPGPKSLVFLGWGLGRFDAVLGKVSMTPDYEPARNALLASRTAVFCLDVTDADYHSLELGLQTVAEETGGFYARTHLFTESAVDRLEGALAGHYQLAFEKPRLRPGVHRVQVDLVGRSGTVLYRPSYEE
jgi:VWFA-related protein